jgi:apolipoprotein D and lipocalin family protein
MKIWALAVVFAGFALATAAQAAAPEPTKPVDPAKFFTGRWYEIARNPRKVTDGCVAGWTEYSNLKDGRLKVVDACYDQTPSGKLKSIGATGVILDQTSYAKVMEHYHLGILPIENDEYWVIDHDDAYTWFIEADPTFTKLWLYTRAANPAPELLQDLIKKAQGFGYDTTKLEFPIQTGK